MTEATETAVADADFDRLVALGQSEADAYAYWLAGTSAEKLSPFARRGLAHSFGFVMDKAATALEAEHAARVKAEERAQRNADLWSAACDISNDRGQALAAVERDNAQLREALHLLSNEVQVILNDLGPGGYLLPSGAGKTNALASANREVRALLQGEPS